MTIREWARSKGYSVGERGRIHSDIITAYEKENGKVPTMSQPAVRKDIDKVREWAKEQGMDVSERGRVSAKVKAAYDKAKRSDVSPRVRALAEAIVKERTTANSVILTDKFGRKHKSEFCSWPLDNKMHGYCGKVIMNAALVGGIRKNVICTCECHQSASL